MTAITSVNAALSGAMKMPTRAKRKGPPSQPPRIMKSELTRPARWFIVTKYDIKSGIDVTPNRGDGKRHQYFVAREKFDVTDQIEAIIKGEVHDYVFVVSPRSKHTKQLITLSDEERAIYNHAREYVDKQLATMEKFGSRPELSAVELDELVKRVARPSLEIAKWRRRAK